MTRHKGPKVIDRSIYIVKSRYPVSDGRREIDLLRAYSFWPRRTGKTLFEEKMLDEYYKEKPLNVSMLRWQMKRRRRKKMDRQTRFNEMIRGKPVDGRQLLSGPRKINPTEFIPSDLARHIKICGSQKNLKRGRELHRRILFSDFRSSRFLARSLIEMYGRCDRVDEARRVFRRIRFPDVATSNAMLSAFARCNRVELAKSLFDEMIFRNRVTWNTMVTAYAGIRVPALELFEKMPQQGIVSSTALVVALAEEGQVEEAKQMFDSAPETSIISRNAILQACHWAGRMEDAREMFDSILEQELENWSGMISWQEESLRIESARIWFDLMPQRDTPSWNLMIDAYARNRQADEARRVFNRMPCPDDRSWPIVITGYAVSGLILEAQLMFDTCPSKVAFTWNSMVGAFAQNGEMEKALNAFKQAPEKSPRTWNALLAGFVQVNDLEAAEKVFLKMGELANIASWNVLIHAYARECSWREVQELALEMNHLGVEPDEVTFIGLLNSCVNRHRAARRFFLAMLSDHFIEATVEHFRCMIKALGESGWLLQALELINNMPFIPDLNAWIILFSACKKHSDLQLGALAADQIFKSIPNPYEFLAAMESNEALV